MLLSRRGGGGAGCAEENPLYVLAAIFIRSYFNYLTVRRGGATCEVG